MSALAPGAVQDMVLQLLPGILSDISAVISPAQQQDKNARFQAYRGELLRVCIHCAHVHTRIRRRAEPCLFLAHLWDRGDLCTGV